MKGSLDLTIREHYFHFQTGEGVFSRNRLDPGTLLLVENMRLPEEGRLLDLGCGYGPIGIIAAKIKPKLKVMLADNNPKAISLSRTNSSLNNTANVECRIGSVYEPVRDIKFNTILTNPPLSAGFTTVSRIIQDAPIHLLEDGNIQLVVRKGSELYKRECEKAFGNAEIFARGSGYRVFLSQLTKS